MDSLDQGCVLACSSEIWTWRPREAASVARGAVTAPRGIILAGTPGTLCNTEIIKHQKFHPESLRTVSQLTFTSYQTPDSGVSFDSSRAMAGVLTVSSAASPFPYAALATATYTQKAEISFDGTATGISLDLNGEKITSEDEAVRALAKAAGLADDSAKVRTG